jgi:hypothetical protein
MKRLFNVFLIVGGFWWLMGLIFVTYTVSEYFFTTIERTSFNVIFFGSFFIGFYIGTGVACVLAVQFYLKSNKK